LGAYEFYGGVTNSGRNVEAGYLLKWEAIKDAISLHKQFYDHWGVAPVINGEFDKNHELYNISKFKQGFGGVVVEFLPQQTIVFSKFGYWLYNMGIKINEFRKNLRKRK
jgi:lipid II:glycine glycyltransferase (peptidoglycan interpeptide bridge formation enzyme)